MAATLQNSAFIQRRHLINNLSQMTALVSASSLLAACSKSPGSISANNNYGGSALVPAELNTAQARQEMKK